MSIFKKYLETLVETPEDVVKPKVQNTFTSEIVEETEKVIENKKQPPPVNKDIKSDIDALIKKMLPNAGKLEEESLDAYNSQLEQKPNNPLNKIEEQITPKPTSNVLDTLRKQPADNLKIEQPKGLAGVEYEVYDPTKIHFMKELPRYEMSHKDHSSIIIAKECFLKYFFSSVVCLVPAEEVNIFYPWGTAYHIFRQVLSELYGYGDKEPKTYNDELAKTAFKEASQQGMKYWIENGEEQKPGSKFDWFTSDRLYKSFRKALEHWVAERKKGQIKVIAVEQFFVIQLFDGRFVQGRIDEAILYNNELWGRDFKTTMKPEQWFTMSLKPNNQIKTYTFGNGKLAGRKAKGLFIQAMYNAKSTKKEDKGPDVFEKMVEVSDYELEQWEKEQAHWNKLLQICRDEDVWPMTEKNCQYCEYQLVCVKSTEASKLYTLQNKYKLKLRNPAHVD